MWIAKPITALTQGETATWIRIQNRMRSYGRDFPLSQTLTWARASESIGSEAFLVMEPDLGIGGILQKIGTTLECINGPLLNWDDPFSATREFATFTMGAAKACGEGMSKIILGPRWTIEHAEVVKRRLGFLPVTPAADHQALTVLVPVAVSEEEQLATLSPRIRRSFRKTREKGIREHWVDPISEADREGLVSFALSMRTFGKTKGFFVPDPLWFETLVLRGVEEEGLHFAWVTAREDRGSDQLPSAEILVVFTPSGAHYLFGLERRAKGQYAQLSPASVAHLAALRKCREMGLLTYDLNGYTDPNNEKHPYAGVSRFKAQFGGKVVTYYSPKFEVVV